MSHSVVLSDDRLWDPIVGKPVEYDEYCRRMFFTPIPSSVFYDADEFEKKIVEHCERFRMWDEWAESHLLARGYAPRDAWAVEFLLNSGSKKKDLYINTSL
jgi:hypothetical protein